MVLAKVVIGGKRVLARGIMQKNAFLGPEDILKYRPRQISGGYASLSQFYLHLTAAGCGFSLDPVFITSRKNQQTSFGTGVLDCRAHQRINQLLQNDLA